MQTFLPYDDLDKSVKCLDYRRLGKQRVEAKQILNILLKRTKSSGWRNHPIVKMWEGYENCLKLYHNKCIKEWIDRGYNNTMKLERIRGQVKYPDWFGNKDFHKSHKSNLLRKDFDFYSKHKWRVKDDLPYIWFVKKKAEAKS